MKSQEEALSALNESFLDHYNSVNENVGKYGYMTLEEFSQYWHNLIDKKYEELKNEHSN